MPDFIDIEIARHCPSPRPQSITMINAMPLVLWQILLLAEHDCYSSTGLMRSAFSLSEAARTRLTNGGMIIGAGDLFRKVCGPVFSRYVALRVVRRTGEADGQVQHIRARAETVFRIRLECLLAEHFSSESETILEHIKQGDWTAALCGREATALASRRVRSGIHVPKAIQLGRELF